MLEKIAKNAGYFVIGSVVGYVTTKWWTGRKAKKSS